MHRWLTRRRSRSRWRDDEQAAGETRVRALPERRTPAELSAWRGEVRAIAVVAAGGIAAGAATVAAVSAAKAMTAQPQPPCRSAGRRPTAT